MTHDLRVKIHGVLGKRYPAEVQGCDAKTLDHIGARKAASYLKLGHYSFEAVRFALQDFPHRVSVEKPALIPQPYPPDSIRGSRFARWKPW
ncbi:Uncharacterised protein [Escherichia coli]|nr:hypothetical protein [Escherichia coli]SPW81785.1 Uncharacterised protein [Escherichia coli]